MDTVWMKVHAVKNKSPYNVAPEGEQFVMFGTGGIIRFEKSREGGSILIGAKDSLYVVETPEYIMSVLQKVRNTEGVLDEQDAEEEEEEEDKGSTFNCQAKSSL